MSWCTAELPPLDRAYHDAEWGIPVHDDRRQFEYVSLEVMQCGLSWSLMLKRRAVFRRCFDRFDFRRIAKYTEKDVERILATKDMIRSRPKVLAIINNARAFLRVREEFGTFSKYIWGFCGGKTILYAGHAKGRIPAANGLSTDLSADLRRRGFKFLGPVVVYSHLQACGIVNDHGDDCPRYHEILRDYPIVRKRRDRES